MDYKVASYLLLSCILISHVHSNNLTNTINTTDETPTNSPTYTIPLILQNTAKLTPITITNEKITTKSMTTPITTTNNTTTKTTTTTATTTTTTTPTTTTTMRPCRRMKFINRIHQANPEVLTLVGSTFVIDCSVDHTGGPEPSVYWYKDDIPLQENSFRTFDEHRLNKTFRLRLENVDIPDNGKYKCTVDNVCSKSITNTVSIIVREQRSDVPIISTFEPVNATRLMGEELQLTCGADLEDGEFTPFIKWVRKTSENVTFHLNHTYINTTSTTTTTTQPPFGIIQKKSDKIQNVQNVPKMNTVSYIENDVRYTVTDLKFERTSSSTLLLEDLKEEDSGVYTCVMSNLKGVVRKSSHVTINPVPEPSREELHRRFVEKHGTKHSINGLPILITLPIFVFVILSIAYVWWKETEKKKEKERQEKMNQQSIPLANVVVEPPKPKITIDPALFEGSMCYPSSSERSSLNNRSHSACSERTNDNPSSHCGDEQTQLLDDQDDVITSSENNIQA